ncbi:hypothetical protein SUGI_0816240 [Cryptomeria japonica]|nr:hypothetical protein SUGI_0816240 [Cryptomeria japonica]
MHRLEDAKIEEKKPLLESAKSVLNATPEEEKHNTHRRKPNGSLVPLTPREQANTQRTEKTDCKLGLRSNLWSIWMSGGMAIGIVGDVAVRIQQCKSVCIMSATGDKWMFCRPDREATFGEKKLSLQNSDLFDGSWVDKIICEGSEDAPIAKLIFNLQDDQILFEIVDAKEGTVNKDLFY